MATKKKHEAQEGNKDQITLYIPADRMAWLRERAQDEDRSISNVIKRLLDLHAPMGKPKA
jgi:hypothetical protein